MFSSVGNFEALTLTLCLLFFVSLTACDKKQTLPISGNNVKNNIEDFPPPPWYNTEDIDISLIDQKKTIEIDSATALQVLPQAGQPVNTHWQTLCRKKSQTHNTYPL